MSQVHLDQLERRALLVPKDQSENQVLLVNLEYQATQDFPVNLELLAKLEKMALQACLALPENQGLLETRDYPVFQEKEEPRDSQ